MEHCEKEGDILVINEKIKTLFEHVRKQDSIIETMHKLTVEIHEMASEMRSLKEDINNVQRDISEIKNKPGKRWDAIVAQCITLITAATMGYILSKIGLGG